MRATHLVSRPSQKALRRAEGETIDRKRKEEKRGGRRNGILFERQMTLPKKVTPLICKRIGTFSSLELSDTSEKPQVELGHQNNEVLVSTSAESSTRGFNLPK